MSRSWTPPPIPPCPTTSGSATCAISSSRAGGSSATGGRRAPDAPLEPSPGKCSRRSHNVPIVSDVCQPIEAPSNSGDARSRRAVRGGGEDARKGEAHRSLAAEGFQWKPAEEPQGRGRFAPATGRPRRVRTIVGIRPLDKNITLRRRAQELHKQGRWEAALAEWDRVISSGDPDPYDHVAVGDIHLRLGQKDQAREAYEKASQLYESLGFIRSAIGITKKVLRLGGSVRAIHLRLGQLYLSEGLTAEAAEHALALLEGAADDEEPPDDLVQFLEALRLQGQRRPELSLRLVDLYERSGRTEEAAAELLALASQLEGSGAAEEAGRLRERAETMQPDAVPSAGAWSGEPAPAPGVDEGNDLRARAQAAADDESWLEAVGLLEEILSREEEDPGILEKLVEGYRQLGNHALTITALERLAQYWDRRGAPDEAEARWKEILTLDPDHEEARRQTGTAAATPENPVVVDASGPQVRPDTPQLDIQELLRDFQNQVVDQIPTEDAESHYALALSHHEMGLHTEALQELERALASPGLASDLEMRCRELQERCRTEMDERHDDAGGDPPHEAGDNDAEGGPRREAGHDAGGGPRREAGHDAGGGPPRDAGHDGGEGGPWNAADDTPRRRAAGEE
ncbi:MAG: tetratricopeptide repeat protein [Candidatus Eisenbacteria bacterium]|nr:tetratricopeptide repeat protein [Candidatus Eisenbacteria bacterium]